MRLYDVHNHLQREELAGMLGQVADVAERDGVARMVVNGTSEADWDAVTALAQRFPWVMPSYGLHPWMINDRSPAWRNRLSALWDAGGFVGEIGLDRWKETANFGDQVEIFRWQFAEGVRRGLPVTVHCLRAWGPLTQSLRELPLPERGFLVHAFGGSREIGRELAALGAYFSFSGSFLAPRRLAKAETFRELPIERLLVETDAPSMALPVVEDRFPECRNSGNGEPVNHPGNVVSAYAGLARILGCPLDELADQVETNFTRLFGRDASS